MYNIVCFIIYKSIICMMNYIFVMDLELCNIHGITVAKYPAFDVTESGPIFDQRFQSTCLAPEDVE